MSIRVTIGSDKQNEEISYPCLFITSEGYVIQMFGEKTGVVIHGHPNYGTYKTGVYRTDWSINPWKVFNDSITLENK